MLGKLLKYEIPAMGRKLAPMYIAWAAASLLLGFTIARLGEFPSDFGGVIPILVYAGVTIAVFVMMIVLIIQRYSSSLLGDEAYFNLTLPVTASSHIASKAISALVWTVLTTLAAFLSGSLIMLASGAFGELINVNLSDLTFIDLYPGFDLGRFFLLLFEFIVLSVFSTVKSILAVYAALSIGHLVKKYTVLASIAAYIGLLTAESMVGNIFISIGVITDTHIDNFTLFGSSFAMTQLVLITGFIVTLVLSAVYFLICRYLLEKHLNLA